MIKKFLMVILCVTLLTSTISVWADTPEVAVLVDNEQIVFDVPPIIEEGRTLVPMRFIFEALGAEVTWNGETATATAVKDDITLSITIGSTQMLKNGEVINLDVPVKIVDGRTLVPVRAVSEGLKAKVLWDEATYTVIIKSYEGKFPVTQLSPNDTKELNLLMPEFRYTYEQALLPKTFLVSADVIDELIEKQTDDILRVPAELWDMSVIELVINIQNESGSEYYVPEDTSEKSVVVGFYDFIHQNQIDAESTLASAWEKTESGKSVLLVEFDEAYFSVDGELMISCKYCAFVLDGENIRYFTAESSPIAALMGNEAYIICEITLDGRINHGVTIKEATVNDFLKAVDNILSGKTE